MDQPPRNLVSGSEQRLPRRDVQRPAVWPPKGHIGDHVLDDGQAPAQVAPWTHNINPRGNFIGLVTMPRLGDPRRDVQVPLDVDRHPITPATGGEINDQSLAGRLSLVIQVESPDLAIATGDRATVDDIQRTLVG